MLSKEKKDKLGKTLRYLILGKTGFDENEIKISALDFSFYTKESLKKLDSYMIYIDFNLYQGDPDIDLISDNINKNSMKIFNFFSEISLDELGRIVSQKNNPNVDFKSYIMGPIIESIDFKWAGETLKYTVGFNIETIEVGDEKPTSV